MDPTFVSENLASWAVQTSAADMKQQQEANRIAESETVQELKDALHFATQELKTAKEENASLKKKIAVLEDAHKMEVSSLQEELKLKDEALQRCVKKRRARTKAWVELLHESTIKDMEINTREQHWSSKWQSTEKSLKEEKKKWRSSKLRTSFCLRNYRKIWTHGRTSFRSLHPMLTTRKKPWKQIPMRKNWKATREKRREWTNQERTRKSRKKRRKSRRQKRTSKETSREKVTRRWKIKQQLKI
ncbi:golgin subfamily A member 6-like protein 2 [Oreochromis aureus]|uniref:golgin subfamily A member 6-like protein 2 n=1 Tax=Oreochromis aureus TaxID=47969 RepID=UPI001952F8F1|nr:golgin subfamily A member 6-like protein 2 [Oreochromis aureus]